MKIITKSFLLTAALMAVTLVGCEKDEVVNELKLSKTAVEISAESGQQNEATVNITSGNGSYQAISDKTEVVATVSGEVVTIRATAKDADYTAKVTVKDTKGKSETINVKVITVAIPPIELDKTELELTDDLDAKVTGEVEIKKSNGACTVAVDEANAANVTATVNGAKIAIEATVKAEDYTATLTVTDTKKQTAEIKVTVKRKIAELKLSSNMLTIELAPGQIGEVSTTILSGNGGYTFDYPESEPMFPDGFFAGSPTIENNVITFVVRCHAPGGYTGDAAVVVKDAADKTKKIYINVTEKKAPAAFAVDKAQLTIDVEVGKTATDVVNISGGVGPYEVSYMKSWEASQQEALVFKQPEGTQINLTAKGASAPGTVDVQLIVEDKGNPNAAKDDKAKYVTVTVNTIAASGGEGGGETPAGEGPSYFTKAEQEEIMANSTKRYVINGKDTYAPYVAAFGNKIEDLKSTANGKFTYGWSDGTGAYGSKVKVIFSGDRERGTKAGAQVGAYIGMTSIYDDNPPISGMGVNDEGTFEIGVPIDADVYILKNDGTNIWGTYQFTFRGQDQDGKPVVLTFKGYFCDTL